MNKLYNKQYGSAVRTIPDEYKDALLKFLKPEEGDQILEIGVNKGELLRFIREYSPNTHGIDVNEEIVKEYGDPKIVHADATKLPHKENFFNKSFSSHTLEHIPDLYSVFKQLERVTKDGGLSLHFFPSALIRGVDGAFWDAWKITKNPIKALIIARQLHVHNLNPQKIQQFINGTRWKITHSEKIYVPAEKGSAWLVLLKKG